MTIKAKFAKLTMLMVLIAALTNYAVGQEGNFSGHNDQVEATAVRGDASQTFMFSWGAMNFGKGQSAIIHVDIIHVKNQLPVVAEFMVYDPQGNVLASQSRLLGAGRAESFDIRGIIAISNQTTLIPCLKITGTIAPEDRDLFISTLDVYDTATGKTQFTVNNPRMIIGVL